MPNNYIVVDEDPMFRDSTSVSTHFIHASIGNWLSELHLETKLDVEYFNLWRVSEDIAIKYISEYVESEADEGAMVRSISRTITKW